MSIVTVVNTIPNRPKKLNGARDFRFEIEQSGSRAKNVTVAKDSVLLMLIKPTVMKSDWNESASTMENARQLRNVFNATVVATS